MVEREETGERETGERGATHNNYFLLIFMKYLEISSSAQTKLKFIDWSDEIWWDS